MRAPLVHADGGAGGDGAAEDRCGRAGGGGWGFAREAHGDGGEDAEGFGEVGVEEVVGGEGLSC